MPLNNRATEIYAALREEITQGLIVSNKEITESRVAKKYEISRNTAKKALLMLENDGLLVLEDHKSPSLCNVSLEEVSSLLDLRAILEGYITENATSHITKRDIALMESYLNEMRKYIDTRELLQYIKCNQKLHQIIYVNCNNQLAVKMLNQVKDLLRRYNAKTILIPGRDVESLEEHIRVVNAISTGQAHEAGKLMEEHILNLKRTFEQNVELLT